MTPSAASSADDLPESDTPNAPDKPVHLSYLQRVELFLWTRRPQIVPTIAVFLMLPLLLALGTWQMSRLHQKNELIAQVEKTVAQSPQDLRLNWPKENDAWTKTNYHAVALQGRWLTVHSFKLAPRTYEGQVGYQLIVPLRLKDDQIVLVNRGFVPDGDSVMPVNENDMASVTGIARVMEDKKPAGMAENIPSRNQWTWFDIEAMGHETGFSHIAPVAIYEARDPSRDAYPIGGQLPLPLSNSHWHYAATWYALALILLGVYVMSMNPKQEKQVDSTKPSVDEIDPVARRGLYPEATD